MTTKVYNVRAPDGSMVKVRGPEGASPEEVITQAKKLFAERAPAPQEQPAPEAPQSPEQVDRGTTLSSLMGDTGRAFATSNPVTMGLRQLEKLLPESMRGTADTSQATAAGMAGGMADVVEGVRQAGNAVGDNDPEELALLNQDTATRRAKLAELTKGNETAAGVGQFLGQAAPYAMGGSALGAVGALPQAGGVLARAAGAAGAGGLQGYASALTPEQEAAGGRGDAAKSGAFFGGAAGLVGSGISSVLGKISDAKRSLMPKEAAKDFLKKTTGLTDDTAETYAKVLSKTDVQRAANKEVVDAAYDNVLKIPEANFDVPLHALDRLTDVSRTPVTEEIFNSSDAVKHIMDTARLGKNTPGAARTVPFPIMAQAVKDLNEIANNPALKGQASSHTAEAVARDLRDRINLVGEFNPNAKPIIDAHESVQDLYKNLKLPVEKAGPGAPVGSWVEGGKTEKDFADTFLGDKSGMQLNDLFNRVPEAEGDVKKLWATTKSAQPEFHRDLGASTARDVIFKNPAERKYADQLSEALRRGSADDDAGIMEKVMRSMSGRFGMLGPVANALMSEKATKGILKYGEKSAELSKADKMRAALMSSALLNSLKGEE